MFSRNDSFGRYAPPAAKWENMAASNDIILMILKLQVISVGTKSVTEMEKLPIINKIILYGLNGIA
eukprot:UN15465